MVASLLRSIGRGLRSGMLAHPPENNSIAHAPIGAKLDKNLFIV